jgi:transcriptional regulator with XRE-family HTH domain
MNRQDRPKTSAQFAAAVDIHYSMASRLRSGERRPSLDLLIRIIDAYGLDINEAVHAAHTNEFGSYLEERVFSDPTPAAA